MRLLALCAALCAGLCGCVTQKIEMMWVRADRKPVAAAQLEADRAACALEIQNAVSLKGQVQADEVFRGCMARRGYIQMVTE